ncbi:MAG: hypothetical protein L0956_03260 [Candidatus Mariimomonas ferrooxydans]
MPDYKKDNFIRLIKHNIIVLKSITALVVFILFFVSVKFTFKFLDYVPTLSVTSMLFFVSILVVISLYLAQFISKSAIEKIAEKKHTEEIKEQQLKRLNVLHSVEKAITSSLDLRVTLDVLLNQVTTQLNIDAATVLLLNPQTQILEYIVSRGFRSSTL